MLTIVLVSLLVLVVAGGLGVSRIGLASVLGIGLVAFPIAASIALPV